MVYPQKAFIDNAAQILNCIHLFNRHFFPFITILLLSTGTKYLCLQCTAGLLCIICVLNIIISFYCHSSSLLPYYFTSPLFLLFVPFYRHDLNDVILTAITDSINKHKLKSLYVQWFSKLKIINFQTETTFLTATVKKTVMNCLRKVRYMRKTFQRENSEEKRNRLKAQ